MFEIVPTPTEALIIIDEVKLKTMTKEANVPLATSAKRNENILMTLKRRSIVRKNWAWKSGFGKCHSEKGQDEPVSGTETF